MTNILLLIIIGYLAYKEIMARKPKKTEEYTEEKEQLAEELDKVWAYKIDDAVNSYKRGDE